MTKDATAFSGVDKNLTECNRLVFETGGPIPHTCTGCPLLGSGEL